MCRCAPPRNRWVPKAGDCGTSRCADAPPRLSSDVSEIKLVFRIPPERPTPNFAASWNVAPTDPLPVVPYDAKAGQGSLDMLRWGLIPYWAKDINVGFANINAKAEGSRTNRLSARHLSDGAVLCRSTIFTNGKRPGRANSLMRSPIAASWRSRAYGRASGADLTFVALGAVL